MRLWLIISHKYLRPVVEAIEGVKSSICWCIVLVAEPKMPFPNGVSHVTRLLEVVGHQGHVDGDARWHEGLDVHVLPSHPVRVLAGHHGHPAWGAGGLHVVLV